MPYLRVTCPTVESSVLPTIAIRLTEMINELFYQPRGRMTREELCERTTVHFIPYANGELFIGGCTPAERDRADITVEISDWGMSVRQQRKVACQLTPVLAELFDVPPDGRDGINLRFHSYPPTDFAVGGRLLSEVVPQIGQFMKRTFG